MQHLHNFNNFELITENKKGFFSGLWSVLTLGGYVTSKLKNTFGLKSILIKNKLNRIEDILKNGLKNLSLVFPTERVIQSNVDKNEALKAVKSMTTTGSEKQVGVNVYSALSLLMFEIEKAILIYEEDQDLNLMKEEIETICTDIAAGKKVNIPNHENFKKEIKDHVKTLRLNKKLVSDMTQRLPRYDLKNLALEASILIKIDEEYKRDSRLSLLFQKRKNAIFSKYEKFYDFDELNNWLDYDRFDPTSVKYREQINAAKKAADAIVKKNNISTVMTWQTFRPSIGSKYYFFFDEDYEWRAILAELISIDGNIQMYKPYGMYRVKKSDKFEFKKMTRKEVKNSQFTNVDFIDTCMYLAQSDKFFFAKNDAFFSKTEATYKFKDISTESEVKEITFFLKTLKGLGIFKIDDELSSDKIDTDNWKKYDVSNFKNGLNVLKDLIAKFYNTVPAAPLTVAQVNPTVEAPKEEKKGGWKVRKMKKEFADKEYLRSIQKDLFNDLTAAMKTIGLKMKDEQLQEFVKSYLEKGEGKYSKNYEEILSTATKELIKRKK